MLDDIQKFMEGGAVDPMHGNDLHTQHESHFAFPAQSGIRLHLNAHDANENCEVGVVYKIAIPMQLVSKDEGGFRFNQVGVPAVEDYKQGDK